MNREQDGAPSPSSKPQVSFSINTASIASNYGSNSQPRISTPQSNRLQILHTPRENLQEPLLSKRQTTAKINEDSTQADVLRVLKDEMTKEIYYGSYEDLTKAADTENFLRNITYQIDLSKLYKIIGTCYVNQNMPYCPILVEHTSGNSDHRYQLQVWDSNQQLIYTRDLHLPPVAWFVSYQVLVFKPAAIDQDSPDEDCYFIIFLYKGNSYVKVNVKDQVFGDIQKPRIGFCNRCLYISSDNLVYIINCIQTIQLQPGQCEVIEKFESDLRMPTVVDLGELVKNHGFAINQEQYANDYLVMSCETSDNQIDFSILAYNIKSREVTIKQIQEVIQRQSRNGEPRQSDPIRDFKHVQTRKFPYAVALRDSGKVDFYWNYLRIGHAKSEEETFLFQRCLQVEINFRNIYIKFIKSTKQISLDWNGRIGLDVAEEMDPKCIYGFQSVFYQMIQQKVNFYNTSVLINTSFFIAHNNMIYMYDIIKQAWNPRPYECQGKVKKLFRCEKESGGYFNIGILLEDGSFDNLENSDFSSFRTSNWLHKSLDDKPRVQGKIKHAVPDQKHNKMLFLLSEREGEISDSGAPKLITELHIYTRNQLFKQEIAQLNETTAIYPLISPSNDSMFVVQTTLFTPLAELKGNRKPTLQHNPSSLYLTQGKVEDPTGISFSIYRTVVKKVSSTNREKISSKLIKTVIVSLDDLELEESKLKGTQRTVEEEELQTTIEAAEKLKSDSPHTALTLDSQQNVVLFGKVNAFKVEFERGTISMIENCNITGIQMVDNNHCYAIFNNQRFKKHSHTQSTTQGGNQTHGPQSIAAINHFARANSLTSKLRSQLLLQSTEKKEEEKEQRRNAFSNIAPGLKYMSLKVLVGCLEPRLLDIETTITGPLSYIDYSQDNERLTYLKNYQQACIIPILHRTTINFMGMLPRENYLAFKKIKSTFLALDRQNRITVWNVLTGKLVSEYQLSSDQDYSQYEIFGARANDFTYQRQWSQPRTLLVRTNQAFDMFKYSQVQKLSNEVKQGLAFIYNENIAYNMFKLVEIESETSIKEHCVFIHGNYQEKFQRLFISSDLEIMIEILVNLRVNIYKAHRANSSANDTLQNISFEDALAEGDKQGREIRWVLLRRFQDFPHDLSQVSESLFMFSPDLKNYINFDKVKGQFFIKNTQDNTRCIQIPQRLMNPQKEEPKESVKRFKWVGNSQIIIASYEGYETLFNLEGDQLVEASSSMIYAYKGLRQTGRHIYIEQESFELGDVANRLLRKNRELKRTKYLFEKDYQIQIYDQLFEVDFNVGRGRSKHVADLSFSVIYWKIIEELINGNMQIEYLDQDTLYILCLNVLPGCRNILHKLSGMSQILQKLLQIVPIYKLCTIDSSSSQDQQLFEFEMPLLCDLNNRTPLHQCLDNQDFKVADLLLQYLAKAPLDHHGKALKGLLPKLIEQDLPSLVYYFQNRLMTTQSSEKINRGHIVGKPEHKSMSFAVSSIWMDSKDVRSKLFSNESSEGKKKNLQSDVQLYFIDLPDYHFLNTIEAQEFFEALKGSDRLELFELPLIRYLIDYSWPEVKSQTRSRLFVPFVMYLFMYWIYTNVIYDLYSIQQEEIRQGGSVSTTWGFTLMVINMILLCLISVYFLVYEYKQMKSAGLKTYLSSSWNYIDLTPPVIILSQAVLTIINSADGSLASVIQTIQALSSMLLWIKLLYFFRINRSTGYLIRMVAKVFIGIKTFLGVLLITIVAFADGFTSLQADSYQDGLREAANSDQWSWWFSYIIACIRRFIASCFTTYTMILGEFGILESFSEAHEIVGTILFLGCTLFVMIVMLNLLISIIGQVYSEVQENQVNEFYHEKAAIISENNYLIPNRVVMQNYRKGHYLIAAKKVEDSYNEVSKDNARDADAEAAEENSQQTRISIQKLNASVKAIEKSILKIADQTNSRLEALESKTK